METHYLHKLYLRSYRFNSAITFWLWGRINVIGIMAVKSKTSILPQPFGYGNAEFVQVYGANTELQFSHNLSIVEAFADRSTLCDEISASILPQSFDCGNTNTDVTQLGQAILQFCHNLKIVER